MYRYNIPVIMVLRSYIFHQLNRKKYEYKYGNRVNSGYNEALRTTFYFVISDLYHY